MDPESPILPANFPALQPPKERIEITLEPKILDGYVGIYQFTPTISMTITRKDNRLYIQLTGQQPIEVFPESERAFFLKVVNAQLVFESDGKSPATAVTLRQNGRVTPALRIAD